MDTRTSESKTAEQNWTFVPVTPQEVAVLAEIAAVQAKVQAERGGA